MEHVAEDVFQRARARVGQVLRGKWRLDHLLGVGGTACVYAATHRNGKRGAVKLLRSESRPTRKRAIASCAKATSQTASSIRARSPCSTTTARRTARSSS
ncbi:hypothetical protein [Polyangium mundeleinium]|uniref:Protein kinase domain-containing protein n=1 Tax=Polyangium mundeleinium TaxID=2995306 RepID=A0ABT5F4N6_9BACT|nr:hypothetical protein [Polyangium mundeleinium]MDC0748046.1 hypothetical protein [Polyangium mundeleinium]